MIKEIKNPYRELHKHYIKMKTEFKAMYIEAKEGCEYWEKKADEFDEMIGKNKNEVKEL